MLPVRLRPAQVREDPERRRAQRRQHQGADPYREDPYSPLDLGHDDLRERDRWVFDWAKRQGLPLAWVLAGGYTPDVSKVVAVHLGTFEAARTVFGP